LKFNRISGSSTKDGLTKLDFSSAVIDSWIQFMKLLIVDECLVVSVTLMTADTHIR
jgi:hypothetical protein